MEVILAQSQCIDPRVLAIRGFPEPSEVGALLRQILEGSQRVQANRKPDAFSIRSGPSVIGTALRSLRQAHGVIHEELNGCSDNPLCIDGEWLEGELSRRCNRNCDGPTEDLAGSIGFLVRTAHFFASHTDRLSEALPSFLIEGTGLNSGFMLAQYTRSRLCRQK